MSHPLDQALRDLAQHFVPLGGVAIWRGEVVVDHGDGTVDLKPADSDEIGPGLMQVPVWAYGGACQVAPGAPCLFIFAGKPGDLSDPIVIAYGPGTTFLRLDVVATALNLGDGASTIKLAGGSTPVARLGDAITGTANLMTGAVTGTGGTPGNPKVLA